MKKSEISNIQDRVLALVPEKDTALLKDSCSEVTRLVAGWLIGEGLHYKFFIYKGDNVLKTNLSHDVLVASNEVETVILDPTVWQFKPEAKSILIGTIKTPDEAIEAVKGYYGGTWCVSEEITQVSEEEKKEYLDIITQNAMKEN